MPVGDLPVECLQGRLGEICLTRFKHFPRAYSWPALLATASSMIDQDPRDDDSRVNLFACLVGGVHTGKSQAIHAAVKALGLEKPTLMSAYVGSAEALARSIGDARGNPRLWALDELGVLLKKATIEHSTFPQILCTAWGKNDFEMYMGKKQNASFNCCLSIVGGIVDEIFSDLFSSATTVGLYDRFMFGLCPSEFSFDYYPMNGLAEKPPLSLDLLKVDPEIWYWRKDFQKENNTINPRVVEIAIRAATVCAYFDGVRVIDLKRMEPHLHFINYQTRMRTALRPNPGENFEGQIAEKILDYLRTHPGLVNRRELIRDLNLYRKGPSVVFRAFDALVRGFDIVEQKIGRQKLVRLPLPGEEFTDESE